MLVTLKLEEGRPDELPRLIKGAAQAAAVYQRKGLKGEQSVQAGESEYMVARTQGGNLRVYGDL